MYLSYKNSIPITILFIFIILSLNVQAQEDKVRQQQRAKVKGIVTCKGEPVPYVNVLIKGTHNGTMTNPNGRFILRHLAPGENTLLIKGLGYKTKEKTIEVKQEELKEVSIQLEEDVLQMDNVVVTGTRTKHYVKKVPVKTEVIPARQIETQNESTLFQALKDIPGIHVQEQCQFCNFTTMRMQGLESQYTQILMNGLPIYSGLASVYGLQQLSIAQIDRIEVVKGAGSALYGSSAMAGAINIITEKPAFSPMTTIDMKWGRFNTNTYKATTSLRNKKGNVGAVIYAQKSTGDPVDYSQEGLPVKQKDGITDRVSQNLTNGGASIMVEDMFSKNDKLNIRGNFMSETRRGGILEDNQYKNPFSEMSERIITERYVGELSYETTFRDSSALEIGAAYVNHNRNATNDTYLCAYESTYGESPSISDMRPYLADENTFSSIGMYSKSFDIHHLLAGIQFSHRSYNQSGKYVALNPLMREKYGESFLAVSKKHFSDYGIFLQDEISVLPRLQIVPGIRLDHYTSEENYPRTDTLSFSFDVSSVNPRLAVKYDISRRFTMRLSTGTGFRPPAAFAEDLHLCSGSPRIFKTPGLKPERAFSYNVSGDYYGENIRLGANIFRNNLYHKINFIGAEQKIRARGYNYQWENLGDAYVQGFEFSWRARLLENVTFHGDITVNQGRYKYPREDWQGTRYEEESEHISQFPLHSGHLGIQYSAGKWRFTLDGSYKGPMYIDYYKNETTPAKIKKTDPYILLDAQVSKSVRSVTFFAKMENITDFVQPERHLDDAAFIYAPLTGRMYYAGMKLKLKH